MKVNELLVKVLLLLEPERDESMDGGRRNGSFDFDPSIPIVFSSQQMSIGDLTNGVLCEESGLGPGVQVDDETDESVAEERHTAAPALLPIHVEPAAKLPSLCAKVPLPRTQRSPS